MFNKVANVITGISVLALVLTVFYTQSTMSQDRTKSDVVVLSSDNLVNLNSEVSGDSVGAVISKIKTMKGSANQPIYLFLNTPGGSIQAGLELVEALNGLDRKVTTVTMFAASMGFDIVQSLDERLIVKNGTLMSHRAYGQVEGEYGGVEPSQMTSRYLFAKERIREMDEMTVSRTKGKQTLASYLAAYTPELWLTGKKAVEGGYADRVVTVKCDKSLGGVTTHSIEFLGVPVSYDLDQCPLNTSPQNVKVGISTNQGIIDSDQFIKQGGHFDASCLIANDPSKLCSLDTSMNVAKINAIKRSFVTRYLGKQRQVVPMTW